MPKYKPLHNYSRKGLKRRLNNNTFRSQLLTDNEINSNDDCDISNNDKVSNNGDFNNNDEISSNDEVDSSDINGEFFDFIENNEDIDISAKSDICSSDDEKKEDYVGFLVNWKVKYKIASVAMNSLLSFLRINGLNYLPKDSRTLMQTPVTREVVDMPLRKYIHVGLKNGIDYVLSIITHIELEDNLLLLDINIDGLPISKSSNISLWLILGQIHNTTSAPFVIGLYFGTNKPASLFDFLKPHVDELKSLINSYEYDMRSYLFYNDHVLG